MKIESPPRISTSENSRPLTPSTFMEKAVSGSANFMLDIFTDFLALLYTFRRAVGVPRSVNTVSKLTVSAEKDSVADGEVVKSSEIQPTRAGTSIAIKAKASRSLNFLMPLKRPSPTFYYDPVYYPLRKQLLVSFNAIAIPWAIESDVRMYQGPQI